MADEQAKRDPNYVTSLIAVSSSDFASTVRLWADPTTHRLLVDVGTIEVTGAGDGAILDGASASIKASVLDYTNSNPLAVRLTDTNGDYIAAGAGTQYTEDAAAAANPIGNTVILIRQDTPAGKVTTDGDNVAQGGTNYGAAYVTVLTAAGAEVGFATAAKQDTIITSVQLIDDAIKTDDAAFTPATDKVMMVGAQFDDNTPDSVDEGDAGALRMSANRNLFTTIRDAAGNERGVNVNASNQLAIAGPVTNAGTFVVQENGSALTALQVIDNPVIVDDAAFTPATTSVMMAGFTFDDASPDSVNEGDGGAARMSANRNIYTTIRDAAGNERGLNISANGNISIDTVTTITTVSTVTTVSTLTGGGVAHDSADSGNPHKIGFKAYSPDGTTPGTAVAEGDRTDAKADLDGRQYVNGEHPNHWSYHEDSSSALTDTTVKAAPGAGFELVITEICVSTGAATALNFFLEEGSTKIFGPIYLEAVAGRGMVWRGNKHITANTAVTITTSAAIAHSIDIQGYTQAV